MSDPITPSQAEIAKRIARLRKQRNCLYREIFDDALAVCDALEKSQTTHRQIQAAALREAAEKLKAHASVMDKAAPIRKALIAVATMLRAEADRIEAGKEKETR